MKKKMFLSVYEPQLYAVMRIVIGFLFLWHGSQKLFSFPPLPAGIQVPMFITIVGGGVEFFGGLLVMAGFCSRWAAFLSSGEMAVAYWMAHGTHAVLPMNNGGEMAMLYCFAFLYIAARGSGIFSVDNLLLSRKREPAGT